MLTWSILLLISPPPFELKDWYGFQTVNFFGTQVNINGESVKYPQDNYQTDIIANLSLSWLRSKHDRSKPFFMFITPHAPYGNNIFLETRRHCVLIWTVLFWRQLPNAANQFRRKHCLHVAAVPSLKLTLTRAILYVCMCVCTYACIHVCMYVCMHVSHLSVNLYTSCTKGIRLIRLIQGTKERSKGWSSLTDQHTTWTRRCRSSFQEC